MQYSKIGGVVAWSGGQTSLAVGQRIDDDHPLATERPDLFTSEDPGADIATVRNPGTVERATSAPGEVRETPARGPAANRVPKGGSAQ